MESIQSNPKKERVVILGASDKPERYSHRALRMLLDHGHEIVLVHPRLAQIEGRDVVSDLGAVTGAVDTITMYVGPDASSPLADKLLSLKPTRVIFNPGAENPALRQRLMEAGIRVEEACTLVLLSTGQF
jgi:hypothetical protein